MSKPRNVGRIGILALLLTAGMPTALAAQDGIASIIVNLRSLEVLHSERLEILDRAVAPGSVIKIATLAAALESGVATGETRIVCTRTVVIAGHRLTCSHPPLHRALTPTEALAHSCNVYFAAIAQRLPRGAFDSALASLGLPPSDAGQPLAVAAMGLAGVRIAPRRMLELIRRVVNEPNQLPWKSGTLAIVRDGLGLAAQTGTAAALARAGVDGYAKTGTTIGAGVSRGMVVGAAPRDHPTVGFVLVASGAAGIDAAALAAERLAATRATGSSEAPVRVGRLRADGGYSVSSQSVEDYVAAVVSGEAAPSSTAAALEALAITVRTFTRANRGRHRAQGFDLCETTHCQVPRPATPAARQAALSTSGRVLLSGSGPAAVHYTASCGGHTERPSSVWPNADTPPFLPSAVDDACGGAPHWSAEIGAAELTRALRAGGFTGDVLRGIRVRSRTASGRVAWLALDGFTPGDISGEDFRTLIGRTAGWQHVRSTRFDLERTSRGYRVRGSGAGHGVGLCVIGSARRAGRGESAAAILSHYFPGLALSTAQDAADGVRILLPSKDRGEDGIITAMVAGMLRDLQRQLSVSAPETVSIRFHPTVESFQRDTGRASMTAAATLGREVHLLPLSTLKQRGILEQTLRHELVHLLTADALKGRPLWVVEGLAVRYSGEAPADVAVTDYSCPSDRELTRPPSREALRHAYARAGACVARALNERVGWRDIRP